MRLSYSALVVLYVAIASIVNILLNWTHFSPIDTLLTVFQCLMILFYANKVVLKRNKIQSQILSGDSITVLITFLLCIAGLIIGILSRLPPVECLIIGVYPLFSSMMAMMCFPEETEDEAKLASNLKYFLIAQIVLTLAFGYMPHHPKPWRF